LLLLALGMSLVVVLGSISSVLLGARGMFPTLRVIALAVMLSCGAMRLSRVLVMGLSIHRRSAIVPGLADAKSPRRRLVMPK
jgi:hypothetical protein